MDAARLRRRALVFAWVVQMPELDYEAILGLDFECLGVKSNPSRIIANIGSVLRYGSNGTLTSGSSSSVFDRTVAASIIAEGWPCSCPTKTTLIRASSEPEQPI